MFAGLNAPSVGAARGDGARVAGRPRRAPRPPERTSSRATRPCWPACPGSARSTWRRTTSRRTRTSRSSSTRRRSASTATRSSLALRAEGIDTRCYFSPPVHRHDGVPRPRRGRRPPADRLAGVPGHQPAVVARPRRRRPSRRSPTSIARGPPPRRRRSAAAEVGVSALVTGGAGFIGSHLVDALVADGARVVVLDDLSTGAPRQRRAGEPSSSRATSPIPPPSPPLMRGCDVVFHLAARGSVQRSVEHPLETDRTNVGGHAHRALRGARRRRAPGRAVVVVVGLRRRRAPADRRRTQPLQPRSPYAVSKLAGEHYARVFAELHGLETVTPALLQRVRPAPAGRQPVRRRRPPLHRRPAPTAARSRSTATVARAATSRTSPTRCRPTCAPPPHPPSRVPGRVYNIARGEPHTVLELLATLAELLGVSTPPPATSTAGPATSATRRRRSTPPAAISASGRRCRCATDWPRPWRGGRREVEPTRSRQRGRDAELGDAPDSRASTSAGRVVAIIGQGHVGLPVAMRASAVGFRVVGFDTDAGADRVRCAPARRTSTDVADDELAAALDAGYRPTDRPGRSRRVRRRRDHGADAARATASPTSPTSSRRRTSWRTALRPGALVVLESTTYPGTTNELVRPILERAGPPGRARLLPRLLARADRPRQPDLGAGQHAQGRVRRRRPSRCAASRRSTTRSSTRSSPSARPPRPSSSSCSRTRSGTSTSPWSTSWRCTPRTSGSTSGARSTPRPRSRSATCGSRPGPASAATACRSTRRSCRGG